MDDTLIIPVLLTGGSGTRLWPVSRDTMPKQFLPIFGDLSTYQQALKRVTNKDLFAKPIVMTSEDFRFFTHRQAQDLGINTDIVLEPARRDSCPAIIAASLLAYKRDPHAIVAVFAADHLIPDLQLFEDACRVARNVALQGYLVTFGIRPTEPKTSYGYIRRGGPLTQPGVYAVDAFVEKPIAEVAVQYVANGYLWNSGNFIFSAKVFLEEAARYEPEMLAAVREAVENGKSKSDFFSLEKEAFTRAPKKSVDYAIMERTSRAAVVEGLFRWSDIGSWEGVFQMTDRDASNNAVRGSAVMVDTQGSLVHAEGRLTTLLGVKDLAVITTADAVLVTTRERSEDVKKLVGILKDAGHAEATEHLRVYRPWGHYETVNTGDRFKVKRITVTPGAKLSLQRHLHRAEHWVVVHGVAEVTVNEETRILHENESLYVPMTATHRLANPGKIPLELIEVQTGSYLGEDDITRFDDLYNRS